jgi:hypothetical protein
MSQVKPMRFKEWKSSVREVSHADAAKTLGYSEDDFGVDSQVLMFSSDLYITRGPDGKHCATVSNDGWLGTFDEAAGYLYFWMYVGEHSDEIVRFSDGSFDDLVNDLFEAHPEIDLGADDWGGIMDMVIRGDEDRTDYETREWTASEVQWKVHECLLFEKSLVASVGLA